MGTNSLLYRLKKEDLTQFPGYHWLEVGRDCVLIPDEWNVAPYGFQRHVLHVHQKRHDWFIISTSSGLELRHSYSLEGLNHDLLPYVAQHRLGLNIRK